MDRKNFKYFVRKAVKARGEENSDGNKGSTRAEDGESSEDRKPEDDKMDEEPAAAHTRASNNFRRLLRLLMESADVKGVDKETMEAATKGYKIDDPAVLEAVKQTVKSIGAAEDRLKKTKKLLNGMLSAAASPSHSAASFKRSKKKGSRHVRFNEETVVIEVPRQPDSFAKCFIGCLGYYCCFGYFFPE